MSDLSDQPEELRGSIPTFYPEDGFAPIGDDQVPPAPLELPPITEAQWKRILGPLKFRPLVSAEQQSWAGSRARRCMGCENAGTASGGEPWRAWCTRHRVQVSNTFPVLCREWRAA